MNKKTLPTMHVTKERYNSKDLLYQTSLILVTVLLFAPQTTQLTKRCAGVCCALLLARHLPDQRKTKTGLDMV